MAGAQHPAQALRDTLVDGRLAPAHVVKRVEEGSRVTGVGPAHAGLRAWSSRRASATSLTTWLQLSQRSVLDRGANHIRMLPHFGQTSPVTSRVPCFHDWYVTRPASRTSRTNGREPDSHSADSGSATPHYRRRRQSDADWHFCTRDTLSAAHRTARYSVGKPQP